MIHSSWLSLPAYGWNFNNLFFFKQESYVSPQPCSGATRLAELDLNLDLLWNMGPCVQKSCLLSHSAVEKTGMCVCVRAHAHSPFKKKISFTFREDNRIYWIYCHLLEDGLCFFPITII